MTDHSICSRFTTPALAALLVAACGDSAGNTQPSEEGSTGDSADATEDSSDTSSTTSGDDPSGDYQTCDDVSKVGRFEIKLQATGSAGAYTSVQGTVQHSIDPTDDRVELQRVGDCWLEQTITYACEPACEAVTERCGPVLDGDGTTCHPKGKNQHAGLVEVTGLRVPMEIEPNGSNFYSNPSGSLPEIGFDPGAAIELKAAGHDIESDEAGISVPAFELSGWGISYLEADSEIVVEDGLPLTLTWQGLGADVPAKIRVELGINRHGPSQSGQNTTISCETADTGSLTIDAALITALFDDGISGWPGITFWRQSADAVDLPFGCVELLVRTEVGFPVEIPGFISCSIDEDCPDGQVCNSYLYCEPQ